MSLKLVELQVALPRTQDVGKMQEQLQQKGQITQDHLANNQKKADEKKKKKVNENPESQKYKKISDEDKSQQSIVYEKKHKNKKQDDNIKPASQHPFKGTFLDIEG